MLQVHKFKTGELIQRYPDKQDAEGNVIVNEYGRLIVCEKRKTWQKNEQGQRWLRRETRVGFVQGRMAELEEEYGHLEYGDVVEPDLIIQKVETTKKSYDSQEPKQKPAQTDVDGKIIVPAEDITYKGALVYMNFLIEEEGTEDILLPSDKKTPAPKTEDSLVTEEEEEEEEEFIEEEEEEEVETPPTRKRTAKKK